MTIISQATIVQMNCFYFVEILIFKYILWNILYNRWSKYSCEISYILDEEENIYNIWESVWHARMIRQFTFKICFQYFYFNDWLQCDCSCLCSCITLHNLYYLFFIIFHELLLFCIFYYLQYFSKINVILFIMVEMVN